MINERYSIAMAETLYYLKGINQEDIDKIPKKFMEFLITNAHANYKCEFDYTRPLNELKLKDETRGIIAMICLNYWCETEEQKIKFSKHLSENEMQHQEELRKKYDIDNIFNKEEKVNNLPMKKEEENIFKRILNKIIKFFNIK